MQDPGRRRLNKTLNESEVKWKQSKKNPKWQVYMDEKNLGKLTYTVTKTEGSTIYTHGKNTCVY